MDKVFSEIKRFGLSYKAVRIVLLFGSCARGDNTEKSGYAIAVIASGIDIERKNCI